MDGTGPIEGNPEWCNVASSVIESSSRLETRPCDLRASL